MHCCLQKGGVAAPPLPPSESATGKGSAPWCHCSFLQYLYANLDTDLKIISIMFRLGHQFIGIGRYDLYTVGVDGADVQHKAEEMAVSE